jgi:hypothetical protein
MPRKVNKTTSTTSSNQVYQDIDGSWMNLSEVLREFQELRVVNQALHDLLFRHKITVKEIAAATHAAKNVLYKQVKVTPSVPEDAGNKTKEKQSKPVKSAKKTRKTVKPKKTRKPK